MDPLTIIAALEDNHMGRLDVAQRMVDAACTAGADAVKVSLRNIETSYAAEFLNRPYLQFPELGTTYRDVLTAFELTPKDFARLREHARGRLRFIAAPYDQPSLDAASSMDVDGWQIDPSVFGDRPLLEQVAAAGKVTFAAAGMVTDVDVTELVRIFAQRPVELLHCVAAPDLPLEQSALGFIPRLQAQHGVPVGYLALDGRTESASAAIGLGARTIEVPFTLEHALRGPGHARALDRDGLTQFVRTLRAIFQSLNVQGPRRVLPGELDAYQEGRKALVAVRDLPAGTLLGPGMLVAKAPHRGLSPRLLPRLMGKRLLYDLPADRPVTFGDISE